MVGHGDEQPPAAPQHAPHLGEEGDRVRHVLEHLRAPHDVDLAVAERERAVGRDAPQVGAGDVAPRARQRRLGQLHADRLGARVAQRGDEAAGAAAEVEHPLARLARRAGAARGGGATPTARDPRGALPTRPRRSRAPRESDASAAGGARRGEQPPRAGAPDVRPGPPVGGPERRAQAPLDAAGAVGREPRDRRCGVRAEAPQVGRVEAARRGEPVDVALGDRPLRPPQAARGRPRRTSTPALRGAGR